MDYSDLLLIFAGRDIRVRYKQTALGIAWAVLQPVLLMVVFTVLFGRLGGLPSGDAPYAVTTFVALVPWLLFSQTVSSAALSVVANANVVTKVYFPRLVLPIAASGPYLLDFGLAATVLGLLMLGYGVAPTAMAPLVLLFLFMLLIAALGVGTFLAAINVRYRDVQYAVPFLLQLWLFASPVAYSASLVPDKWHPLLALNPMFGVVEGFRWAILGANTTSMRNVAISAVVSVALFLLGASYFTRSQRAFADVV